MIPNPLQRGAQQLTPAAPKPPAPSGATVGTRGPMNANHGFNKANQVAQAMALRRRPSPQLGQVRSARMPVAQPVIGQ